MLLLGAWSGYRKGFVMALFSFAAILLGAWGAFKLMDAGQDYLARNFNITGNFVPYLSFLLIFLLILIGVKIIGRIIRSSIEGTVVGEMDQWLGAGLGLIRYMLVASVLLVALERLDLGLPASWTAGSVIFPVMKGTAPWLAEVSGNALPDWQEMIPAN